MKFHSHEFPEEFVSLRQCPHGGNNMLQASEYTQPIHSLHWTDTNSDHRTHGGRK